MSLTTDRWAHRVVKNGRVKICGDYYLPRNKEAAEQLEGMRLAFGRYPTMAEDGSFEYDTFPFVNLWGSMEMWHSNLATLVGKQFWHHWCALVGERIEGDGLNLPSGSFLMFRTNKNKWIAYRSLGLDWWDAEDCNA